MTSASTSLTGKRAGHATTHVETGAVTGVHRAGASLNVHVHFHVLCLDGVYVEAEAKDGTLRFEAAPAPSREELQETLEYVYARVLKWLARRGLLREADASNEAPSPQALASVPRPSSASHPRARHGRRRARALQPPCQRPCPRL